MVGNDEQILKVKNLENKIMETRKELADLSTEFYNAENNELLKDKVAFFQTELIFLSNQCSILKKELSDTKSKKVCNNTNFVSNSSINNLQANSQTINLGQQNVIKNIPESNRPNNITNNATAIQTNNSLNNYPGQNSNIFSGGQPIPNNAANNNFVNMNVANNIQQQNVNRATTNNNIPVANNSMSNMGKENLLKNDTLVGNVSKQNVVEKSIKNVSWENKLGKKVMPILASCFIFAALILFAVAMAPYMTDTMKQVLYFALGGLAIGVGLYLKNKEYAHGFANVIIACGIGDLFVSLLVCRLVFQSINDIVMLLGVIVWLIIVNFLKKNSDVLFQIIAYIGITTCIIWGTSAAIQVDNADDLLVLYIFYLISTAMCYFLFRKTEDSTSNIIFHIFNVVNLLGCFIGIVRCADYLNMGVGVCGTILAVASFVGVVILLISSTNIDAKLEGAFAIIYFALIETFLLYTLYKADWEGIAIVVSGCIAAWLFIILLNALDKKSKGSIYEYKNLIEVIAVLIMIAICTFNSCTYGYLYLIMLSLPMLLVGYVSHKRMYKIASAIALVIYSIIFTDITAAVIMGSIVVVIAFALMCMKKEENNVVTIAIQLFASIIFSLRILFSQEFNMEYGWIVLIVDILIFSICLFWKWEIEDAELSYIRAISEIGFIIIAGINAYLELSHINYILYGLIFIGIFELYSISLFNRKTEKIKFDNFAVVGSAMILFIVSILPIINGDIIILLTAIIMSVLNILNLYLFSKDSTKDLTIKIISMVFIAITISFKMYFCNKYYLLYVILVAINFVMRYTPLCNNHVTGEKEMDKCTYYINQILIFVGIGFCYYSVDIGKMIIAGIVILILPIGCHSILYKLKNNINDDERIIILSEWILVPLALLYIFEVEGFIISIIGMLIAVGYIVLGFKVNNEFARKYGLTVSMIMVIKLVFFDFTHSSLLEYAICLFVAGLLCLGIYGVYYFISNNIKDNNIGENKEH